MKKKVKKQWVAALRSGEYQQGTGYLNRDGKQCCLGVLCELAVKAKVIPEPVSFEDEDDQFFEYGGGEYANGFTLPLSVQKWAGLKSPSPGVLTGEFTKPLSFLNDTGSTFSEIADLIEEHL